MVLYEINNLRPREGWIPDRFAQPTQTIHNKREIADAFRFFRHFLPFFCPPSSRPVLAELLASRRTIHDLLNGLAFLPTAKREALTRNGPRRCGAPHTDCVHVITRGALIALLTGIAMKLWWFGPNP